MQIQRVDTKGAALILGLSAGTLEVWRCLGKGPRYMKIGRRVFYGLKDLESFATANVVETVDSIGLD
ncbi:MAG: helix-turn-helix domain-containing protein [Proteobacteria bacterium]|nr:helix-turn-helix domain-containing protein [Pseudomonadota bacterium]